MSEYDDTPADIIETEIEVRVVARTKELEAEIERMRHEANEWADCAVNGLQYLRNIRDGISSADEAIQDIQDNIAHCHSVKGKKP